MADVPCPICDPESTNAHADAWDGLTREHLEDRHPGIVRAVATANARPYERPNYATADDRAGDIGRVPYVDMRAVLSGRA